MCCGCDYVTIVFTGTNPEWSLLGEVSAVGKDIVVRYDCDSKDFSYLKGDIDIVVGDDFSER